VCLCLFIVLDSPLNQDILEKKMSRNISSLVKLLCVLLYCTLVCIEMREEGLLISSLRYLYMFYTNCKDTGTQHSINTIYTINVLFTHQSICEKHNQCIATVCMLNHTAICTDVLTLMSTTVMALCTQIMLCY